MSNLKICLYGIGGVYNYGCEAIVRGTEQIIRRKYPDAEISYVSYRVADDRKRLSGSDINIKPLPKARHNFWQRCLNRLRKEMNIAPNKRLVNTDLDWVNDCDIVLSIGGDVYNLLSTENYQRNRYENERILIGKKIKAKGKKLILWGVSTGPFEKNLYAKTIFISHFQNDVDILTVREGNTEAYLQKNGVFNCKLFSDPAFALQGPVKSVFNPKPLIGINFSPLSIKYCYEDPDRDEVVQKQAELIGKIIKEYDADIILIPHVVSAFDMGDDDLRYLSQIYNRIAEGKERVKVIDHDPGFVGVKEELVKCDLVLASRMHCAINAISCAVPTVFIGYSDKASGMCKYVYGDLKFYITLNDFLTDFSIVDEILNEKEHVNEFLKKRMVSIRQRAYEAVDIIGSIINDCC